MISASSVSIDYSLLNMVFFMKVRSFGNHPCNVVVLTITSMKRAQVCRLQNVSPGYNTCIDADRAWNNLSCLLF